MQLVLEHAAKSQGMPPEQTRAAAKQMLGLFKPDLEKMLGDATAGEALESFLDNPRSIEIRSRPETPIH